MEIPYRLKTRALGGGAGAPSSLLPGELAYNEDSAILYFGRSDDVVIPIGGLGAVVSLSTNQTITGNKVFSGTVSGTGFDTAVRLSRLDQMAAPTGNVSFNGVRITNLADPSGAQDAATKAYVDAARAGLDTKGSVRAATTANITLSGEQTIDGVAVVTGDRVLVKNQSTGANNGIYVCDSSTWTRATDADASAEVTSGMYVFVEEGTTNENSGWVLTTDNPITLGSTALTFVQFTGAGQITAGAGLTKTGNTIDIVGTSNRITVNADSIDISSAYVGQASITTLGTITSGTWQGTAIGSAYLDLTMTPTWTGVHKWNQALAALTSGDGIVLENTVGASSTNYRWSPRLRWQGRYSASGTVDWTAEVRPTAGGFGTLMFSWRADAGSFNDRFALKNDSADFTGGSLGFDLNVTGALAGDDVMGVYVRNTATDGYGEVRVYNSNASSSASLQVSGTGHSPASLTRLYFSSGGFMLRSAGTVCLEMSTAGQLKLNEYDTEGLLSTDSSGVVSVVTSLDGGTF